MKKLTDLSLDELHTMYAIITELCSDYSKMTDNYSLASGDSLFEHLPDEVKGMIENRQLLVSYRLKLKDALFDKVIGELSNYA